MAASKSARAPAPPGADPFRRAKRRNPPPMAYLTHGGPSFMRLMKSASAAKAIVTIQPSVETGSSPHPRRRGPNHALLPITGEVRTAAHYCAPPPAPARPPGRRNGLGSSSYQIANPAEGLEMGDGRYGQWDGTIPGSSVSVAAQSPWLQASKYARIVPSFVVVIQRQARRRAGLLVSPYPELEQYGKTGSSTRRLRVASQRLRVSGVSADHLEESPGPR